VQNHDQNYDEHALRLFVAFSQGDNQKCSPPYQSPLDREVESPLSFDESVAKSNHTTPVKRTSTDSRDMQLHYHQPLHRATTTSIQMAARVPEIRDTTSCARIFEVITEPAQASQVYQHREELHTCYMYYNKKLHG
jgi:hypothetical protein